MIKPKWIGAPAAPAGHPDGFPPRVFPRGGFPGPRAALLTLLAGVAAPAVWATVLDEYGIRFTGAGWFKSGRIVRSTDSVTGGGTVNNYTDNWLQDAGALLTGVLDLGESLEGGFGLGAIQRHKAQGGLAQAKFVTLGLDNFLTQARVTYFHGGKDEPDYKVTAGWFPYKYDYNVKNLGLYLIRGPVYPGILFSSFESKEMLPTANMLGLHIYGRFGSTYTQDVILQSETDLPPLFDYSLITVGTLRLGEGLELGAGVNFYHLIPVRPGLTSPSPEDGFRAGAGEQSAVSHPFDNNYAYIDTATGDTTWLTHRGTKLMARFVLDPKPIFGLGAPFGREDLKLYGEAAVLGLRGHESVYGDPTKRIPIVLGLNMPAFGFLDVLSLEVEYYGSEVVPDYRKLADRTSPMPQTPWVNRRSQRPGEAAGLKNTPYDTDADNFKWSLYGARVFAEHVKLSGQVARDHFRTGGSGSFASYEEALVGPEDWYWMLKLTYFF